MSSKRYSSLLLTALFVSSTAAAFAGSKSMLDPYCAVQPPASKKPKQAARQGQQDTAESTHTTYISMPMPNDPQQKKAGKLSLFSHHPKEPKEQKQEAVAEAKPEKHDSGEPGIAAKSIASVKSAGSGIVGGTKAAGSKIVEGSKAVGGGIASGTKKIGGGIASGAKASGGYLMKGVTAIGHGFKATGEKVKDGAGSAGTKVAGLPKLWGKKGNDQEKAKQQAIAKAIADRKAAQDPAHQVAKEPAGAAKDPEWNDETANAGTNEVKSASQIAAPVSVPAAKPLQSIKTAKAPNSAKGQSKLAGITGGFSKAFSKLNPFGGKSTTANAPNLQHAVVRPQSEIQSTAATSDAIPQ